ncbi:uncharacterized protein LOC116693036 [Etheostoma spectabile]|uniref:uncharacterized protein LOC116693036 n=1 Tax=Etheostoma spectabile TaxID=54343 RepID=UPI0013AF8E64|nr:uncharacterized protein LOC116693036 [Etheostoma spectabile]
MTANVHLLVLVLGCEAAAGIFLQIFEERSQVILPCPHSGGGNVTWSRERNGVRADILTVNGDGQTTHIQDPKKQQRYGSLVDKSLVIIRAVVSDSGRYFCNDEAVDLIPSGTTVLPAPERTSVSLTCPHDVGPSHVPTWTRDSGGLQQGPEAQTLTIRDVQPGDAGLYYCDGKPAVYLDVTRGDKAPPTTTTTTAALPPTEATTVPSTPPRTDKHTTTKKQRHNRKSKRKNLHVKLNGYGSNRHDHTYDTVPHLPPEKKNAGTSLPNESPYSLIGNPYKDSSQVAVGAYCLLEKPKVTPND